MQLLKAISMVNLTNKMAHVRHSIFEILLLLMIFVVNGSKAYAYVGDYDGIIELNPIKVETGSEFHFACNGIDVERQRIDIGVQPTELGKIDWVLILNDTIDNHVIEVNTKLIEKNKYDIEHDENISITLSIDGEIKYHKEFGNKLPITKSPIFIRLSLDGEKLILSAGSSVLDMIERLDYHGFVDYAIIKSKYNILVNRYSSLYDPLPIIPQIYDNEAEVISALNQCNDPKCGIWEYFDEEVDTKLAMKGGRYKIAILPSEYGGYNIIYLSGADIDSRRWRPGSMKGFLEVTPFVNTFTLYWKDSEGEEIADQTPYATFEGALMVLTFPLQKAKFRFVKNGL